MQAQPPPLTRAEISDAVSDLGWRYVLARLRTSVAVTSMQQAVQVAAAAVDASGNGADESLAIDLRPRRVVLTVQSAATGRVTERDIGLAARVTAALAATGVETTARPDAGTGRRDQVLEVAIDALDIPAVRLFWKAVLGYDDEPGPGGPEAALVDPLGQGPAVWFQQMDSPRPQRNRIHVDVSVPHDEATRRVQSAVAAGGRLVSDSAAPAFWVLADAEGNEACVSTWQGRDA